MGRDRKRAAAHASDARPLAAVRQRPQLRSASAPVRPATMHRLHVVPSSAGAAQPRALMRVATRTYAEFIWSLSFGLVTVASVRRVSLV
mgnify:CR=1 FL=1